jgi:hypothetical protein
MLRMVTHRHIEGEHIELAFGAVARIRDAWQLSGRHHTGWLVGKRISGFAGTGEARAATKRCAPTRRQAPAG